MDNTFEVAIEKLVFGGAGLARHAGKVVFVPFSAPGDHLLVRCVEEKKNFIRAEIVSIIKPGSARTTPACPYFQRCGGCQWQHIEYGEQVQSKRRILEETFLHRFSESRIEIGMIPCPAPFGYRSRARVQMRGSGKEASTGFFRFGSHIVQDIERCPLMGQTLNECLTSLRRYAAGRTDQTPQQIDIASSEEEGFWATTLPDLNGNANNDVLQKRAGGHLYSVTPSVFFQANDFLVSELVALVVGLAKGSGRTAALDLFSGVGLFSLPLAKEFDQVFAVESSVESCCMCNVNAAAAGLGNIRTVCTDASSWLSTANTNFDAIVLDPPRTGTGSETMKRICGLGADTIVYVSCDPQTLVRDLTYVPPNEYVVDYLTGLDLFPQSYHFETVARLVRR